MNIDALVSRAVSSGGEIEEIARMRDVIAAIETELAGMRAEIATLHASIASKKGDLGRARESGIPSLITGVRGEVSALEAKLVAAVSSSSALKSKRGASAMALKSNFAALTKALMSSHFDGHCSAHHIFVTAGHWVFEAASAAAAVSSAAPAPQVVLTPIQEGDCVWGRVQRDARAQLKSTKRRSGFVEPVGPDHGSRQRFHFHIATCRNLVVPPLGSLVEFRAGSGGMGKPQANDVHVVAEEGFWWFSPRGVARVSCGPVEPVRRCWTRMWIAAADATAHERGYDDSRARALAMEDKFQQVHDAHDRGLLTDREIAEVEGRLFASGADRNALAIDTFVRFGAVYINHPIGEEGGCRDVNTADHTRRVIRWLVLRGLLIDERKIGAVGANSPLRQVLCSTHGPTGPIARVAKFLTVPVYQEFPDYLHITIARPATSEYSVEYTMSTLLARQGTRLWETADLSNLAPAFRNPTAIVCVADGSRVTSFEVATLIDGPGCLDLTEMSIEAVDAAGNSLDPVEILIPMQRCGSCSGTDYHTRNDWRSYTLQTFEVDTSATQFLITLRHSNVGAPNTRSYAGLAIFRARGSAAHAYY